METTKDKLLKAWKKTKSGIVNASLFVADKTKKAFNYTKDHIESSIEQSRINKEIKHRQELKEYRKVIEIAKGKIVEKRVEYFVDDLGSSPTELFAKSAKKIKESFPIPVEQTVLWAYVIKETNRVGGIVITECGIFTKTVVSVTEEKALNKENRKVSELFYYPWDVFEIDTILNDKYITKLGSYSKEDIKAFLDACKRYEDSRHNARIKSSSYYSDDIVGGDAVSVSGSMLKETTKFSRDNGFGNNPNGGFGLFAERANNMADIAEFKNAKVVGGDNAKNGPDRLVNGVRIQTKYYPTGRRSVEATFDNAGTGNYRYYNPDGTPMKLEVPKGQYDSAVLTMRNKITEGKVPGVNNPDEAERIIVEGHYTYDQAVRISKAGTIESLVYDFKTGVVATTCVFGISFLINSFLCYRKTHNLKEAVIDGLIAGGKTGALAMSTHILVSQLSRTDVFSSIMSKELIRSGAVSALGGFIVFSIPETYKYAVGKISKAQYFADLATLSASIIGGTAGAYAGGAIGTAVGTAAGMGAGSVPLAIAGGTGGVVGGVAVGTAAGVGTSKLIDIFYEGDDKRIARLFNAVTFNMMNDYLLDETEIDSFINSMNKVSRSKLSDLFKSIHQSKEQINTIKEFLDPYFEEIVSRREKFNPDLEFAY